MPKTLILPIKRVWFDAIASGEKTEEYREIKQYWARRLLCVFEEMEYAVFDEMVGDMKEPFNRHDGPEDLLRYFGAAFKDFDRVEFRNGYSRDSRKITLECNGISISKGRLDWGAEKDQYYFTLKLAPLVA